LVPSNTKTIKFIEFTYCHDKFPEQAITQKHAKYVPLINNVQRKRMENKPHYHYHSGSKRSHTQTIHQKIRRPQHLKV
jgi:hypothetical protein